MRSSVIALIWLVLLPTTLAAAATAPDYLTLIPGATPEHRSPDGNTIVFEDRAGLIVFDTGRHPEHQAAILSLAHERGKPVSIIINSHWHLDHSGGNRTLRRRFPHAALYTSGAVRDALQGFLANSRRENLALLADPRTPESRTLLAGDLVVLPVPFFDTACAEGWRRALDDLATQPFIQLFPGHGPPLSRAEFDIYHRAFGRLVACGRGGAAREQCVDGWLTDAAPLLHDEPERKMARAYLAYYIDHVIREAGRQREYCGPLKKTTEAATRAKACILGLTKCHLSVFDQPAGVTELELLSAGPERAPHT